MFPTKREGVVIQFSNYPRKKGDKSLSFTLDAETKEEAYARVHHLYAALEDNEEVTIKHIKKKNG